MASSRKGLLRGLPRRLAQAAAKKAWLNRDLPNWRDRVGDLLKGKQIIVNGLREWNSIYVAARLAIWPFNDQFLHVCNIKVYC